MERNAPVDQFQRPPMAKTSELPVIQPLPKRRLTLSRELGVFFFLSASQSSLEFLIC